MPNFPGSLPSATPATHGEVVDELRAIAGGIGFLQPPYTSSFWYQHPGAFSSGNHGPTTGVMFATPVWLPHGTLISHLGEWVATAGSAGAVRRLGVYADNGSFYPGALLVDAGTYDGTGATGFRSIALGSNLDVGGLTWFASVCQVAITTVIGVTNSLPGISNGSGNPGAGNNPLNSYQQTGVTGALPSTFTSTRAASNGGGKTFFKIA